MTGSLHEQKYQNNEVFNCLTQWGWTWRDGEVCIAEQSFTAEIYARQVGDFTEEIILWEAQDTPRREDSRLKTHLLYKIGIPDPSGAINSPYLSVRFRELVCPVTLINLQPGEMKANRCYVDLPSLASQSYSWADSDEVTVRRYFSFPNKIPIKRLLLLAHKRNEQAHPCRFLFESTLKVEHSAFEKFVV